DVKTELAKIGEIQYTQTDLDRAKTKILKDIEAIQNNTISTAISLTEIIGSGDYRLAFLYRDNIENLTLDDINRVAKKYFKDNNRTVGLFIPSKDEIRVKPTELPNSDINAQGKDYKG